MRELSLIAFPIRELFEVKLNEFDLIIFDRYKQRGVLPSLYIENIARYVENGGAVLEAAGPDFATPRSLYQTPLGRDPARRADRPGARGADQARTLTEDGRPLPDHRRPAGRRTIRTAALGPLVPPDRRRAPIAAPR